MDLDTVNKVDPGIVQINKLQELARPKDFFLPNAYNIKIRKSKMQKFILYDRAAAAAAVKLPQS